MKWISALVIALSSYLFAVNHLGAFMDSLGIPAKKRALHGELSPLRDSRGQAERPAALTQVQVQGLDQSVPDGK